MSDGACDQFDEGLWRQSDALSTRAMHAVSAQAKVVSGYTSYRTLGEPRATVDTPNMRAWEIRSTSGGFWPGGVARTMSAPSAIDDNAKRQFFQTNTKARGYGTQNHLPSM